MEEQDNTYNKFSILVVDDDQDIVNTLSRSLNLEGFKVNVAFDGQEALQKILNGVDLILLETKLPTLNGFEICKRIKQSEELKHILVIFHSEVSSDADEVYGLKIGADDFIVKPSSLNRIIARIKLALRNKQLKSSQKSEEELNVGPLLINRDKYLVQLYDKKIHLAKKEFELLHFLAVNAGKVLNRTFLLEKVWGRNVGVLDRTVDVHLLNIRKKFGEYSALIETIKGVGYKLNTLE